MQIPILNVKLKSENALSFIALAVLFAVSSIASPYFLQVQNILNILKQVSFSGIIALGMAFIIISGGIDLSVGSMTAFIGALCVLAVNKIGDGPAAVFGAFAVGLAVGAAAGFFNGIVITKGRVAPFIVTLGTLAIFRSLTLYIGNAGQFISESAVYGDFGMSYVLGVPTAVWIFFFLAFLLSVLLNRTRFGRYVCAVGSNEKVAKYSAIDVDRVRLATYVITGMMVGVSAVLLSSRMNSVNSSNTAVSFELDAIAAVVIGGTPMKGGRGTIWGVVVGAVILGIINNMLNMLSVSAYLQGTVKGLVIIAAVFIQRGSSKSDSRA
ncbi:MAG: ribose ABC transporter permease [Treponema sp. GWB1_62_6]|nr:MAG: ribose ABC transporter permease [Treponema sp. GWC1_61_84]OHE67741.1 MAG: ribose ABC transporter permease [Treponema sp. GWB1_62_6]OHE75624.1 MAG: ribose ABC transporter permease [Treponema sp. RIFOXYC1_FULL_61_9]HCM27552.1 ribose ABC transporter permease [Treponema sp.]